MPGLSPTTEANRSDVFYLHAARGTHGFDGGFAAIILPANVFCNGSPNLLIMQRRPNVPFCQKAL
jgi:hypothetical protein